jgi:putative restriction endonuclease
MPLTSSWMQTSSWGQPVVSNGLPLTKIHHAAFDAHLIGVDPDFRIHVSDRLLEIRDGPFLELGLKGIVGQVIELPRRTEDQARSRPARREVRAIQEVCITASTAP